jgi:hypothetical protein
MDVEFPSDEAILESMIMGLRVYCFLLVLVLFLVFSTFFLDHFSSRNFVLSLWKPSFGLAL